jgi:hypothetical protein
MVMKFSAISESWCQSLTWKDLPRARSPQKEVGNFESADDVSKTGNVPSPYLHSAAWVLGRSKMKFDPDLFLPNRFSWP